MGINDFYLATTLSLVLSLFVEEYFGLLSGGMIVPGILALHWNNPMTVFLMILISLIIYVLVEFVISKHVILFGRRKFAVTLLLALLFKVVLEMNASNVSFLLNSYRGISTIAPALLASSYSKQGIKYTLPTCLSLSFLIYVFVGIVL